MRVPVLPTPLSWYPGHMNKFMQELPSLLRRTDMVLEVRDARLPLTSINTNFELQMVNWSIDQQSSTSSARLVKRKRFIVMNKADLVPGWGIKVSSILSSYIISNTLVQPFTDVFADLHPGAELVFVSCKKNASIKQLHKKITSKCNEFIRSHNCYQLRICDRKQTRGYIKRISSWYAKRREIKPFKYVA